MINKMISSTPALSISGGSSAEIYSDKSRDNYGLGEDLAFNPNSNNNIAIGENVLNSSGNAAIGNVGIGNDALTTNATGDGNIAIGQDAAKLIITGSSNIAIGYQALDAAGSTSTGGESANIAIGYNAMGAVDHSESDRNIAIGHTALGGASTNAIVGCVTIGYNAMGTGVATEDRTIAIGESV